MNVLVNKSYKSYNKMSRYSSYPYYYHTLDDRYTTGTSSWLDNNTIYTSYTVQYGDSYDSLAVKFYNNPTYFWIICDFNRILDPYEPLIPGTTLKIPSMSNLQFQ